MADVSDRIARLSPQRQELLANLRRAKQSSAEPIRPVSADHTGPVPLSYAQRRLWFVHQMGQGTSAYNVPVVHRVTGALDIDTLAASLRIVIERHATLRTVFPERDGEPVQEVRDIPEPVVRVLSVDQLPPEQREEAAERLLREETGAQFDLVAGPVMRTTAIRIDDEHHILVLNTHHITSDQISMGVLVSEIAECYQAVRDGREPELEDLPVSYLDYALWQREQMSGAALHDRLQFWEKELAGLSELDIPGDRPRPPESSNQGAETALWLPEDIVTALRAASAAAGTSPFMTLLAGFVGLLSRYTGEHDIAVGTTSAGREIEEVSGLVGFFVNTVVLRTDVSGNPAFSELLSRIRKSVLDSQAHADLPFDVLVEHLRPVRDPSRPPLVSVLFQQDNTPDCALRIPGLDIELVDDFDPGTSKYDLLVSVRVWDKTARVHAQYNTDLFDAETVDRMLTAYRVLLEAAIADPSANLGSLPLLDESDAERVLVTWNDTAVELGGNASLTDLFERQVRDRPDAVAVIAGGQEHTFAELDRRANQLARHLIRTGVRPGALVATYLGLGVDYVVAILATLKAGGAFVPVDPEYPQSRIAFILADCAAPVVITTERLAGTLDIEAAVVSVDGADRSTVDTYPTARPEAVVSPDDPCYVIYTSGSTGTPKGVVLRHRGVVNNLLDLNTRFRVGAGDSVLALSSPSFDMSVYELLGVPGAGGTVILPEPELHKDPAHWADLLVAYGVTLWNSAPALLELLLDYLEQSIEARPESLRLALLGGDWIPVSMPDRLRAIAPELEFISLGGATEASIHSIIYPVDQVDPKWTSIPYGTPMANQQAFILDEFLQPVPAGVPGELHLSGVGVGLGYLNRPKLSAEKFILWRRRTLYKTGDVARWRPDGVIELLGRKDFLVKVNGLRIELGEVEAVLRGHDRVTDATVVARTDAVGDRQLVGFLVSESNVDPEDVRAFAERRLPGYMVPVRFAVLDKFPLSPNGKVDRKALTTMPDRPVAAATEPPRGPVEERVAAAWRQVLGVDELSRSADFFALGGDSFKAVRVARMIDSRLPVIAVFRNPSIAALAEFLGRGDDYPADALIHRLTPPRDDVAVNLVCVPYGGGNAVAYQPMADALDESFALWSVNLPGHDLADDVPLAPIDDVAVKCAQEIKELVTGPVALYGQCAGTAATLLLGRALEDIGVPVIATFMAAALPDNDPRASWKLVVEGTEDQLFQHMRRLGGFDGALSDEDIVGILRVVRHDLAQMVGLYVRELDRAPRRLAGPVHCVVGDQDPATANFEERYHEWGRYGSGVTLSVVPGGGHYFCKHQPQEVAELVTARLLGQADRLAS